MEFDNIDYLKTCLDFIKTEYDYTTTNSTKLDNKIYVLVFICMFLSYIFYSLFKYVNSIFITIYSNSLLILGSTVLLYTMGVFSIVSIFIVLLYIIRSKKVARLDADVVFQDMFNSDNKLDNLKELTKAYTCCVRVNTNELEKIHKIFKLCTYGVMFICLDIVLLILELSITNIILL